MATQRQYRYYMCHLQIGRSLRSRGRTRRLVPQHTRSQGHPSHSRRARTVVIVNSTIERQQLRSMEMRYFWLLDQEAQKMFQFLYQPSAENLADYPSKAHTGAGHQQVRPYYLQQYNSPRELPRASKPSARRGCSEILGDPYDKKGPTT